MPEEKFVTQSLIVSVTLWTGIKILKAKALVNIGANDYTFVNP